MILAIETQQRKIDHPKEIKLERDGQLSLILEDLRAIKPNLPEDLASGQPLVSREKNQVPFLRLGFGFNRFCFFGLDELRRGSLQAFAGYC